MRGAEELRTMRRHGARPRVVFIDAGGADDAWARRWTAESPDLAHLHISDQDMLSGLDLRCVVGLPVLVHGNPGDRVRAIGAECLSCGARHVVIASGEPGSMHIEDLEAEHA